MARLSGARITQRSHRAADPLPPLRALSLLHAPGMYIGSSDPHEVHGVAWHAKKRSLQPASMEIVPGLLKLFDEILVRDGHGLAAARSQA